MNKKKMCAVLNAENRNTNTQVRCCSLCRRPGHNITTCNCEPIRMFENSCLTYIRVLSLDNHNHKFLRFRTFLFDEALNDPNLVRAFAIRRCGTNMRTNMDECIDRIIDYFGPNLSSLNVISEVPQQQPQEEEIPRLNEIYSRLSIYDIASLLSGHSQESLLNLILFMDMIINMRQQSLVESNLNRKFDIKTIISEEKCYTNENCECSICYDEHSRKEFIKLNCGHEFCKNCIKQSLQNERKIKYCCAFCRSEIGTFEMYNESIKDEFTDLVSSGEEPTSVTQI